MVLGDKLESGEVGICVMFSLPQHLETAIKHHAAEVASLKSLAVLA